MTFPFFDILLLAMIAAFIILRLRSVLGRRTGHERPPRNPYRHRSAVDRTATSANDGNVVTLPGRKRENVQTAGKTAAIEPFAPSGSPLARGLQRIQGADPAFDPASFLQGAKAAYEMIVTAFAEGDRKTLKPLLGKTVYETFEAAITDREQRGLTVETTLVGIDKAELTAADLRGRIAEITVKFVSEMISATKNADGAVVEGDPTSVRRVSELWTFERDVKSADPNWCLVGTAVAS